MLVKLLKRYIVKCFCLLFLLACIPACEDVVEINTPSEEPRLIVEALLRVDENEPFIPVEVKVSLTDNFFGNVPVAELESILILYEQIEDNIVIATGFSNLAETEPGSGIYFPDPTFTQDQRIRTSVLQDEINFVLLINHDSRRYLAQTRYVPAVPIDDIVQGSGTLFSEDDTEVIVMFTDEPDRDDFYVFDFDFGEYLVTEDEFYKGQQFQFSYFYDQTFESGTEIDISILGADEEFYNYMDKLIEQGGDLQGPFQTPVATIRGNIFDITDLDNIELFDNVEQPNVFPLGYFAIVQEFKQTLTIN